MKSDHSGHILPKNQNYLKNNKMKQYKIIAILYTLLFVATVGYAQNSITIVDEDVVVDAYTDTEVTVEGNSNLLIKNDEPLINSTVNLIGDDAWLYFESIKPSEVLAVWGQHINVNGNSFNTNRDRVAIYANGSVVIPNGLEIANEAITIYTGKNFTGNSKSLDVFTYHNDLSDFDNKVRSFKLKKGFSATLANNPDGTGFSRYFIASDEDIEFAEMPEGLEFVSFVRAFKWEWSAKKGYCGANEQLNISIFNTWGGGQGESNPDMQFVPMRHNLGWDSWEVINSQVEVSQLLGYNEPDRPDQSDMTVAAAIEQWPEFFHSGLRLGSPAPASTNGNNWLRDFMTICDELNYRVDFMVTHAYQNQNAGWWDWYIDLTSRGNRSLEDAGVKRPVWVTEWNHGANWTGEWWPTASGPRRDADLNLWPDENGQEVIVNRPLSPENSEHNVNRMKEILPAFENLDLFEHHFLYNWVQDARSVELDGKLTPAGKYFANFKSSVGFKKQNEYIHKWKIAPPWIKSTLSEDMQSFNLSWYDHNGETGKRYVLQHRIDDDDWKMVEAFELGQDYEAGETIEYTYSVYPVEFDKVEFRIYAISYKDTRSANSRVTTFNHDVAPYTPVNLNGEAISSQIVEISWNAANNARLYRIERATSEDGEYETVADLFEDIEYRDEGLEEDSEYFYRVYAINTRGESTASNPFAVTTKKLVMPSKPLNLRAASGSKAATLTWDFVYDSNYNILRSDSEDGDYVEIASNVKVNENNARYKDSTVENNKKYFYKIVPTNRVGDGEESAVVSATPKSGQYMHLKFDENQGDVVYDHWGGYHAEFKSDPRWEVGREEKSAVFLSVEDRSHLQFPEGVVADLHDEFTIASWLYLPENAGNNTRMFDFGSDLGTFMVFIPKYNNAGEARYKLTYFKEDGNQYAFQPTFAYNFPLGKWAHVAFTIQPHPQGGLFFIAYLDGKLVASSRDLNNLVPAGMGNSLTNYLGRSQWPNDPYCAHGYDDFRIYNKALNRFEIEDLYNGVEIDDEASFVMDNIMSKQLVSVAPSPVAVGGYMTVTISNVEMDEEFYAEIYNVQGEQVAMYKIVGGNNKIVAPAEKGLYFVRVKSSSFIETIKLLVKE